jgi:hypothetical protein
VYPWSSADWQADHFPYMDVFTINGAVIDGHKWTAEEPIYAPGLDAGGRSRGLYKPERSGAGIEFRWSGPLTYLHAPADARHVALTLRSAAPMPQTLTIEMRGKVIDTRTLTDHEWHTINYPLPTKPPGAKTETEWVIMRVDPMWRPPGDGRRLGLMTRDLRWK